MIDLPVLVNSSMSPRRKVSVAPPARRTVMLVGVSTAIRPGGHAAVLERDNILEEIGGHFAVGVEDVQEHLLGRAVPNRFQSRPDVIALTPQRCGSSGRLGGRPAAPGRGRPPGKVPGRYRFTTSPRAPGASRAKIASAESGSIRWGCGAGSPCGSGESPTWTPCRSRRRRVAARSTRCAQEVDGRSPLAPPGVARRYADRRMAGTSELGVASERLRRPRAALLAAAAGRATRPGLREPGPNGPNPTSMTAWTRSATSALGFGCQCGRLASEAGNPGE